MRLSSSSSAAGRGPSLGRLFASGSLMASPQEEEHDKTGEVADKHGHGIEPHAEHRLVAAFGHANDEKGSDGDAEQRTEGVERAGLGKNRLALRHQIHHKDQADIDEVCAEDIGHGERV